FERVDQVVRHPAQLYEAAAYLLIFLLLQRLDRSEQNRPQGLLFGWLLLLVFSARFCIEFFKINQVQFEANLPLNMGQLLSVPFIAIGAAIICFSQYFPRT
ncbi:MAG: prolipoprotein diacylglyceryl transferase family protein, partial [Bacteroidota bacterium]